MYFKDIGRNRYAVHKDENDETFYGTVEKHEYDSINMATGKRVTKRFWKAHGKAGGWRKASKQQFTTREEAGEYLLKDAATPYNKKKSHWSKRQGESAVLKAAKSS